MPQTDAQKAWAYNKKLEYKNYLREYKQRPCLDCGQSYPYYVMQLDHVRGTKVDNVSRLIANRQYTKFLIELDKCEVVCSNCHAARTWKRIKMGT